jgi:hypothetical protein
MAFMRELSSLNRGETFPNHSNLCIDMNTSYFNLKAESRLMALRLFPRFDFNNPVHYFLSGVPGLAGPGFAGPVPGLDDGLPGFRGGVVVLPHPIGLTSFSHFI